jgi:hypothetical protein
VCVCVYVCVCVWICGCVNVCICALCVGGCVGVCVCVGVYVCVGKRETRDKMIKKWVGITFHLLNIKDLNRYGSSGSL